MQYFGIRCIYARFDVEHAAQNSARILAFADPAPAARRSRRRETAWRYANGLVLRKRPGDTQIQVSSERLRVLKEYARRQRAPASVVGTQTGDGSGLPLR